MRHCGHCGHRHPHQSLAAAERPPASAHAQRESAGERIPRTLVVDRHSRRKMTGPSAFHHDHYDPTDATIDPSLLTAVLSQHNITADNIWIFGFGSLVHTPGFAYAEKATVGDA